MRSSEGSRGLRRSRCPGALEAAATYYDGVGKYSEEASLYTVAAGQAHDSHAQYLYLVNAAAAASRGARFQTRAIPCSNRRSQSSPTKRRAYYALAMNVYAPQKDMAGIKHTVAQAIDNGIDSYEMESLLAGAAQTMGDLPTAIDAIKKIADERPDSFDVMIRLGELYRENHDFNQAVIVLTKAIQLRPDSALAYYSLAAADERPTTTPTPTRRMRARRNSRRTTRPTRRAPTISTRKFANAAPAQAGTQTP